MTLQGIRPPAPQAWARRLQACAPPRHPLRRSLLRRETKMVPYPPRSPSFPNCHIREQWSASTAMGIGCQNGLNKTAERNKSYSSREVISLWWQGCAFHTHRPFGTTRGCAWEWLRSASGGPAHASAGSRSVSCPSTPTGTRAESRSRRRPRGGVRAGGCAETANAKRARMESRTVAGVPATGHR